MSKYNCENCTNRKNPTVQIVQITPAYTENKACLLIGLGSDSLPYVWEKTDNSWYLADEEILKGV